MKKCKKPYMYKKTPEIIFFLSPIVAYCIVSQLCRPTVYNTFHSALTDASCSDTGGTAAHYNTPIFFSDFRLYSNCLSHIKIRPQLHLYLWLREGGEHQRTQLASRADTKAIHCGEVPAGAHATARGQPPHQLCSCTTHKLY